METTNLQENSSTLSTKEQESLREISVRTLLSPIPFTMNVLKFTADVTCIITLKLNQKRINNQNHANIAKLAVKVTAKSGRIAVERLLNGRAGFLQDLLNQNVNDNYDEWIKEIYPVLENNIFSVLHKVITQFFNIFTKEQLFPSI